MCPNDSLPKDEVMPIGARVSVSGIFNRTKLPILFQAERTECAIACLAMLASYHGRKTSVVELRQMHPPSAHGTELSQLVGIAENLGLAARVLKVGVDRLSEISLPAILLWNNSHYVVLKSVSRARVFTIHDPAKGVRQLNAEEFSEQFGRIAIEAIPSKEFQKQSETPRVKLGDFWRRIDGIWRFLAQMLILAIAFQVFAIIFPLANQIVVDDVIAAGNVSLLNVLMLAFGIVLLGQAVLQAVRTFLSIYFTNILSFKLNVNVAQHLLSLPIRYFSNRGVGDITVRFQSIAPVQAFLTTTFVSSIINAISTVFTGAFMLYYAPQLAVITISTVFLYIVARIIYFPHIRRMSERQLESAGAAQNDFAENIRSIFSIKSTGGEAERLSTWQNKYVEYLSNGFDLAKFSTFGQIGDTVLKGVHTLLVLYVASLYIIDGKMTLGMLVAYQSYRGLFSSSCLALVNHVFSYFMVNLHLERLSDILLSDPEQSREEYFRSPCIHKGLRLQSVDFAYNDGRSPVFTDLNLDLGPAEKLAVIGPSGSGKTTLLKLLLALERADKGSIEYDGTHISKLNWRSLRQQVGTVMREDRLFTGTILDNIAGQISAPDLNRAVEAAKCAMIHEELEALPMAYLTPIADLGVALSTGQVQRILIARSLYKRPKMLLLDEAASNLDRKLEVAVFGNLVKLDIPQIWVTHRPTPLEFADRVLQLKNGRLLSVERPEPGTR